MTKYNIIYSAEIEADNQGEAEARVQMNRNLLQYKKTIKEEDFPRKLEIEVEDGESLKIIRDLLDLKPRLFDNIDFNSITDKSIIYKNNYTGGTIFWADCDRALYRVVFYIPFHVDEARSVKVFHSPRVSFVSPIVNEFIKRDMQNEPSESELNRKF